jgi:hypothetical protein
LYLVSAKKVVRILFLDASVLDASVLDASALDASVLDASVSLLLLVWKKILF